MISQILIVAALGSAAQASEKPAERVFSVVEADAKGSKVVYTFQFLPGVGEVDQVEEVQVAVNALPATPNPRFGKTVPVDGARVVVELVSPKGKSLGQYLAHPVPRTQGRYAIHVTPNEAGIFTLRLSGEQNQVGALKAEVKFPVAVWPLPPELQGTGAPEGEGLSSRRPVAL